MRKDIVIRNLGKQPRIFLLTHVEVCLKVGKCLCTEGKPLSVHVLVGSETPTYSAALRSSEVVTAVRKKEIVIVPIEKATGRPADAKNGG